MKEKSKMISANLQGFDYFATNVLNPKATLFFALFTEIVTHRPE